MKEPNLEELSLEELDEVTGGRYINADEQMQEKAALREMARIRAALVAKNRTEDAARLINEYNEKIRMFRQALANSPEGTTVQLSDFMGDTLTRYGL